MGLANWPTNPSSVRAYLQAAYLVIDEALETAMQKHRDMVERDQSMGSSAYYTGDNIAEAEGWEENPDFDLDEDQAGAWDE